MSGRDVRKYGNDVKEGRCETLSWFSLLGNSLFCFFVFGSFEFKQPSYTATKLGHSLTSLFLDSFGNLSYCW